MKIVVNILRVLVGGLFIFSGLVKAIDPLGLGYKMEEFFEVWATDGYLPGLMNWFHGHSLLFSIIMITLEVVLGVALLIGWKKKWTVSFLLLLIIFFTFLTSYVLFSGKIRACGCFGDCIPITPIQTFTKDVLLLIMILFLLLQQKYIEPIFKGMIPGAIVLIALLATIYLQYYVVKHLPAKDCLPYKIGNNILELRKMPADAIPDKYDYSFVYEKDGAKKDFSTSNLPDSTWKFVERKQVLVQAGKNNVPAINDFSLKDMDGNDLTDTILTKPSYYLFFVKDVDNKPERWIASFEAFLNKKIKEDKTVYVVTSDPEKADQFFNKEHKYNLQILTCDATAIKTAARANPTVFDMKGSIVEGKYSWADLGAVK